MTSQSNFKAIPPIRTNTANSQHSQSSGQTLISPPTSPVSPTSRTASPTEQTFFGTISARVRGRSRSRSRDASRKRSESPYSKTHAAPPQHVRHASNTSASSTQQRPRLQNPDRSGSDPWRGRHSNEWLFNGFSVTEATKNMLQRRKS
ncbi:hypothetical protein GQ44DRAFT_705849 [Phaeosphaeriaceae sp. PMI808]|nr:hypothetical protein GQ44DRAFT_705849 [Phaeosphaeriaceae sp. PMI808]